MISAFFIAINAIEIPSTPDLVVVLMRGLKDCIRWNHYGSVAVGCIYTRMYNPCSAVGCGSRLVTATYSNFSATACSSFRGVLRA